MYNSLNRQFLLKQSTQKTYNFFYDTSFGLSYSVLNRRNTWSDPVLISKNAHKIFYAEIDKQDYFHVVFQDLKGTINYTFIDGETIKTQPVLNSKSDNLYNKHLSVIPLLNNINIFFVIYHNDVLILSHQSISNGKIKAPRAIDYVSDNLQPYSVICDKSENIYVFYQSSDGKNMQIGYKKYISIKDMWNDYIPITHYSGNCEFPKTIMDSNDIIHICYQRINDKQFELVYQQKVPNKNMWTDEIIIHSSNYSFDECSILHTNNILTIYWVRNDVIYYSYSKDNGSTWYSPSKYNFNAGKQLTCFKFTSNSAFDLNKIICENIPGVFFNGYKLAFYQEKSGDSQSLSENELKNLLVDGINLLKDNVEYLKSANKENSDKITSLKSSFDNLEKDFVKLQLKSDGYWTEISRLKSSISVLQTTITNMSRKNSDKVSEFKESISNKIESKKEETLESENTDLNSNEKSPPIES